MKKSKQISRKFNALSVVYLISTFCFLGYLPFFYNWNNFLFVELVYIGISTVYSFFVLAMVVNFLQKVKLMPVEHGPLLKIKLNFFHLFSLAVWLLGIAFQLYSSLQGIFDHEVLHYNFWSDELLNNLLIAQVSITAYLLIFFMTIFIVGLVFSKSKTVIIQFGKTEANFYWAVNLIAQPQVNKRWILLFSHQLLNFWLAFWQKTRWTWKMLELKIETIKSTKLKTSKKQTTPPLFLFC